MTALPTDVANRILSSSPDGVVICDASGRVRFWNRGAERIFGFLRIEAVDTSLDLIIPERLRARDWAAWNAVMSTGHTRYAEGQLLAVPAVGKDGQQISIEFSIQLLEGSNGQIEWVVAIIREVTERYERERAIRVELKALRANT